VAGLGQRLEIYLPVVLELVAQLVEVIPGVQARIVAIDPVESYRLYYRLDKQHLLTYTKTERPSWLEN
jgi:hypothetical protein